MEFPIIVTAFNASKQGDLIIEEKVIYNELELASFESRFSHVPFKYRKIEANDKIIQSKLSDLQFRILQKYFQWNEMNSYEFKDRFLRLYPEYTPEQIRIGMSDLHGAEFINTTKNKTPNTLGITERGREKFAEHLKTLTSVQYLDFSLAERAISQPKPTPKSHTQIKYLASFWKIISTHPLWSAVISGFVLLLLSHFIFGSP